MAVEHEWNTVESCARRMIHARGEDALIDGLRLVKAQEGMQQATVSRLQ